MTTQLTIADQGLTWAVTRSEHPTPAAEREAILADPGFGKHFTDHMVDVCWSKGGGWHRPRVSPYGPIELDPAAAVLHYAQEIFEGLKAYRHPDGSIWTFRPEANAARMQRSARRVALPELPTEYFLDALRQLIAVDGAWVPSTPETSLYIRPFMFAKEAFLGVRPADKIAFYVIASPAGAYFPGGVAPVSIWLSTRYARAARGGTGAAKTGGNYAASLLPQAEAYQHGCQQVLFLDAEGNLEELGGMNLMLVRKDGSIITPESDTILEGITRDSDHAAGCRPGHQRGAPARVARGVARRAPRPVTSWVRSRAARRPSWCPSASCSRTTSRSCTRVPMPRRSPCPCARSSPTSSTAASRTGTAG